MARVNITLDAGRTEKLNEIAERAHMKPGTLARSLLSEAIDLAADGSGTASEDFRSAPADRMRAILSGIPGFDERLARSRARIAAGEGEPLPGP